MAVIMRIAVPALLALLLAGCHIEGDFSENIETVILPAEEYEQEIKAIDQLLFREQPLGEAGVRELEQWIEGLAARVGKSSDTRFIKLESLELKLLAKRAGRLAPRGTGKELQNDWMRLRNNLFDDRWWFARSAADLEAVAKVASPATATAPAEAKVVRPVTKEPVTSVASEPRSGLTGKWRVVSITANGEPREDDELTGATWTFDPPRLVIRGAEGNETTYNFTREGDTLHVVGPGEEGRMLYELAGGELRIAFYDGLQEQPESFQHDPSREGPLLLVVELAAVQ